MQADTIDNIVEDFIGEQRSIDDIKSSYPDEWIALGDPVRDKYSQSLISGVVLYHSADKRELAYRDKPLLKEYERIALFFNRVTPRPKRSVIASIYSTPLKCYEISLQYCYQFFRESFLKSEARKPSVDLLSIL